MAAADLDPIIVVNVSSYPCDAFLIEHNRIRVLELPDLKLEEVRMWVPASAIISSRSFSHHNTTAMNKLRAIRVRAEVAADTLQPQWRQLLSFVGESTQIHWHGHPHDWTVSTRKSEDPLPLAATYKTWDPEFKFTNLEESIIDTEQWGNQDPRRFEEGPQYYCKSCSQRQSSIADENECECFPNVYSPNPRTPAPVQIFRTHNGKNNGLIACCTFRQGQAVGEFVGMITKGLADVDVMQSQAGENEPYQIWQGGHGNFTRFINHSCAPNCRFQTFAWLGVQRIVVVSEGVAATARTHYQLTLTNWRDLRTTTTRSTTR